MNSDNSYVTTNRLRQLKTMPYEEYLKTPEWVAKREEALKRDGHSCRFCNTSEHLQVHHRTYTRRGDEDVEDLTTLCKSCHEYLHRRVAQVEIMERTRRDDIYERHVPNSQRWEDALIGFILSSPGLLLHVRGILEPECFKSEDTRSLYIALCNVSSQDQIIDPSLTPAMKRAKDAVASMKLESQDEKELIRMTLAAATHLKRAHLLQMNQELQVQVNDATSAGDSERVRILLQRVMAIQHQLRTIYTTTHIQG